MKILGWILSWILIMVILVFALEKRELNVNEYRGMVVINKETIIQSMTVARGDTIKTFRTFDIVFNHYAVGDTIK